jgi:phospholipid/cholesterol/gamma-HCH transport system permease protein
VVSSDTVTKPVRAIGGFYAMTLDIFMLMFKPPFAWREFLLQTWFVARVSIIPTLMLAIPFTVLVVFTLNILLVEFGAAMCADRGARTIRHELDALRVMGLDPVHRLAVPRVLAATVVAVSLVSLVTIVGLAGSFFFSVFIQHVTPGAFAAGLTLLTRLPDLVLGLVKGALFGMAAALIACYKGMSVGGGPQGVGNAVNETVVYSFIALFVINIVATAVFYTGPQ